MIRPPPRPPPFPYTTLFRSLSSPRGAGERSCGDDHRGAGSAGQNAKSVAAGILGKERTAVRLLHAGHATDPNRAAGGQDRKSTRLNSSHPSISYAVFCLKKK